MKLKTTRKEVLKQVKSLIANSSIIGFDIIELTTNNRVINRKVYFENIFTKKSGAIRHYVNNIKNICKDLNINCEDYFNNDAVDNIGILPFEYSQKICSLEVFNED